MTRNETLALLSRAASVTSLLTSKLFIDEPVVTTAQDGDDRLLDAQEAAAILGVSPSWLYRRKTLPFAVKLAAGHRKYSLHGIRHHIQQRQGR